MSDYIFLDKKNSAYGKVLEDKLIELFFYDEKYEGNIYRAKILNKIEYLNAYFLEFMKDKTGFLRSKSPLKIGDSEIVQVVRDASNKKLPLLSKDYIIETENLYLKRYAKNKHIFFKSKGKFDDEKNFLKLTFENLKKEENFSPTPKLLYEKNRWNQYKLKNKFYEVKELLLLQNKVISQGLQCVLQRKIYFGDFSIIIDELETLTVVDVNTSKVAKKGEQELIFKEINLMASEKIAYILNLRKTGGMVVIDFLRNENNDELISAFNKNLYMYNIEYENHGFSKMGLCELTIKRKSERLIDEIIERKILKI